MLFRSLASDFRKNADDQAALNKYVKKALIQLVEENHQIIGQLVRSRLENLSTEMLVEMIEEKAGNDLQIIRINGSIVGGLAGLAIFLLTFWI